MSKKVGSIYTRVRPCSIEKSSATTTAIPNSVFIQQHSELELKPFNPDKVLLLDLSSQNNSSITSMLQSPNFLRVNGQNIFPVTYDCNTFNHQLSDSLKKIHCRSQQYDFCQNSEIQIYESVNQDSLTKYENPRISSNEIVQKLASLSIIFKELSKLRKQQLSGAVWASLSAVQNKLLQVEREIMQEKSM